MDESYLGELDGVIGKYMPFLVEIRRRLLFTVSLFVIASVVTFIYADRIVRLLLSLFHLQGVNVVFTSPFQFINLSFSIAFLAGIIVIFPLLILQTLTFLKPALSRGEFKAVIYLLPISIALFISGAGFGFMVTRYVVKLFYEQSLKFNVGNFLDITQLLSQILTTSILMGLAFQFPIVMTLLLKFKVIKHTTLAKKRLWVYVAALVFAGLLPPADLLSTVVYFLPLVLLFELALLLNKWILKTHLM